ncbi:MAG: toll/interleukin-1 receptor domain-containing protein [Leptospiraceae bacterium]|nr:toll/interleukin-1 receptor domain-containing protein [Leptospiraceae bacterium]
MNENAEHRVYFLSDGAPKTEKVIQAIKQNINQQLEKLYSGKIKISFHTYLETESKVTKNAVVLFLASTDVHENTQLIKQIELVQSKNLFLLAVMLFDEKQFKNYFPEILYPYNAYPLKNGGAIQEIVSEYILPEMGLTEKDRKVLVSYRRTDGFFAASQLFHELAEKRYSVFLDQYSAKKGMDIQKEIKRNLQDKAFMIFLETQDAVKSLSPWIVEEIMFSAQNHIGVLIISYKTWKKGNKQLPSEQFPGTAGLPRLELQTDEYEDDYTIKENAMEKVLSMIDLCHSDVLLRRRKDFFYGVQKHLEEFGVKTLT